MFASDLFDIFSVSLTASGWSVGIFIIWPVWIWLGSIPEFDEIRVSSLIPWDLAILFIVSPSRTLYWLSSDGLLNDWVLEGVLIFDVFWMGLTISFCPVKIMSGFFIPLFWTRLFILTPCWRAIRVSVSPYLTIWLCAFVGLNLFMPTLL